MTDSTTRDRFHFLRTSRFHPAMGHFFGSDLSCECGLAREEHQASPTICPLLLDKLQALEDLEYALLGAKKQIRGMGEQLKHHEYQLNYLRGHGVEVPSVEQAIRWGLPK